MTRCIPTLLLCLLLLALTGCEEETASVIPPVMPGDNATADQYAIQGDVALEQAMAGLISGDVDDPATLDYQTAYDFYTAAIDADYDHPHANFGAAVLELVMLMQDPDAMEYMGELVTVSGDGPFFIGPGGEFTPFSGGFAVDGDAASSFADTPLTLHKSLHETAGEYGEGIAETQRFLVELVLPRLTRAQSRLENTLNDPGFVFTVTPGMQGDEYADALQLDLTEVHTLMAAISGMEGLLRQFVAYDLHADMLDAAAMQAALSPGSPFLALHDESAVELPRAYNAYLTTLHHLEAALDFLEAETDDQSDDLLRRDPYDGTQEVEVDQLRADIASVRGWLTEPQDLIVDTHNGEETVTLDLERFFLSPIVDFKTLVPSYTVMMDSVVAPGTPDDLQWEYTDETIDTVDEQPSFDYYARVEMHFGDVVYRSESYFGDVPPAYFTRTEDLIAEYSDHAYVELWVSGWWYETTNDGEYALALYTEVGWSDNLPWLPTPVFVWDANTPGQWVFPNPTVNGLLPGMTDTHLKELVGWTPDAFEKTTLIDPWDVLWFFVQ